MMHRAYSNPSLVSLALRSSGRVVRSPDDDGLSNFQPFVSGRRSESTQTQKHRTLATKSAAYSPYSYGRDGEDVDVDVVYLRDHRHANDELASLLFKTSRNDASASESRSEYATVGLDVEWSPNARHSENAIALVQIATLERVLLVHISAMVSFPKKLVGFLEDKTIIKAGVGILCDAQRIYKDFGINVRSCIELSYLARALDEEQWSGRPMDLIALTRLVRGYTGCELAKGDLQMSDWERELTMEQMEYAANDAHASVSVAIILLKRAAGRVDRSRFMFDVVHAKAVCVDSLRYPWQLLLPPSSWKTRKSIRPPESSSQSETLRGRKMESYTPDTSHTAGNGGHSMLKDREMEVWEVHIPESIRIGGNGALHPVSTGWRWTDFFSLLWR